MGTASPFEPERLVIALLYRQGTELGPLVSELEGRLGSADFVGPELGFDWTDYYGPEMGTPLRRGFYSFGRLVDPAELADLKLWTNGIEERSSVDGKRRVNLDPGLLSLGRFTLATTKDRSHRIPLGRGIYAELTLIFERGEWRPLPWTYADWRSPEYRALLTELRERYRLERRVGLKR
jgi:hypothetical protein